MRISTSARFVFSMCAVVAMLAGCNNAATVLTRGSDVAPDVTAAASSVAHRVTDLHDRKNREELRSTGGGGGGSCPFSIGVSGDAAGAFPGTFTGDGSFHVKGGLCTGGFGGSFTITSGTNTISGLFSGKGRSGCNRQACYQKGELTYSATLEPGGKIFAGAGHGELYLSHGRGGAAFMKLTLDSM
jgi:hypothetical protein